MFSVFSLLILFLAQVVNYLFITMFICILLSLLVFMIAFVQLSAWSMFVLIIGIHYCSIFIMVQLSSLFNIYHSSLFIIVHPTLLFIHFIVHHGLCCSLSWLVQCSPLYLMFTFLTLFIVHIMLTVHHLPQKSAWLLFIHFSLFFTLFFVHQLDQSALYFAVHHFSPFISLFTNLFIVSLTIHNFPCPQRCSLFTIIFSVHCSKFLYNLQCSPFFLSNRLGPHFFVLFNVQYSLPVQHWPTSSYFFTCSPTCSFWTLLCSYHNIFSTERTHHIYLLNHCSHSLSVFIMFFTVHHQLHLQWSPSIRRPTLDLPC